MIHYNNLVTDLVMNLVITVYGDKLREWFREEFGKSQYFGNNFSDEFGIKSVTTLSNQFGINMYWYAISLLIKIIL